MHVPRYDLIISVDEVMNVLTQIDTQQWFDGKPAGKFKRGVFRKACVVWVGTT
jgi:hypothetical protein